MSDFFLDFFFFFSLFIVFFGFFWLPPQVFYISCKLTAIVLSNICIWHFNGIALIVINVNQTIGTVRVSLKIEYIVSEKLNEFLDQDTSN